jgi:hypothetical protein
MGGRQRSDVRIDRVEIAAFDQAPAQGREYQQVEHVGGRVLAGRVRVRGAGLQQLPRRELQLRLGREIILLLEDVRGAEDAADVLVGEAHRDELQLLRARLGRVSRGLPRGLGGGCWSGP